MMRRGDDTAFEKLLPLMEEEDFRMAFPCPRCGDRYTQSLPMAYGSGTYIRNWRSRSGYGGRTVSQSIVGGLASPPVKRSLWKPLACLLFVALWFAPAIAVTWEFWMKGPQPRIVEPSVNGTKARNRTKPVPLPAVPTPSVPTPASRAQTFLLILAMGTTLEGLIGWWLIRNIRFNRLVYPGLLQNWQISFMCRQCGTVFYPPDAAHLVINPSR